MTTIIAPDLKPDHTESEERPTLERDPGPMSLAVVRQSHTAGLRYRTECR